MTGLLPAGFPHSGIAGSQLACSSPTLFAAYHALPRLSVPRHPPCALVRLIGFVLSFLPRTPTHTSPFGALLFLPPSTPIVNCDCQSGAKEKRERASMNGSTCEWLSSASEGGRYSPLQKGGDPAAGSPTATLLRLRPSHRTRLRPLPPRQAWVGTRTSGAPDFHGVTGGVYKARERIHRGVADPRLLAIPTSCSRVTDCNPNLDRVSPIGSASRPRFGLSRPL